MRQRQGEVAGKSVRNLEFVSYLEKRTDAAMTSSQQNDRDEKTHDRKSYGECGLV